MPSDAHHAHDQNRLGFAVVTVSDSRGAAEDRSGPAIRERAEAAGHVITLVRLVPNEAVAIGDALAAGLAEPGADVLVFTGGTGFSPRDRTVDTVAPRFERTLHGFGELFRALSFQEIGAAAMLSRATAGTIADRVVFLLPGSTKAVALAMDRLILPEVAHLLGQLRKPD